MALQSAHLTLEGRTKLTDAVLRNVRWMAPDGQAQPSCAAAKPKVAILGAPGGDRRRLANVIETLDAEIAVHETLSTLRRPLLQDELDVVITDVSLTDANWADVLRLIVHSSLRAAILVHSRALDENLRSEAMWRGAQGILVPPHSEQSVKGILRRALYGAGATGPSKGKGDDQRQARV